MQARSGPRWLTHVPELVQCPARLTLLGRWLHRETHLVALALALAQAVALVLAQAVAVALVLAQAVAVALVLAVAQAQAQAQALVQAVARRRLAQAPLLPAW